MRPPDVRQRALSGMAWSSAAHVGNQVIQFGIGIALARLLTPVDFGIIGMIVVFAGFATLFAEFGFSSALVQRATISDLHASSIFWVNIGVGVALTLLFYALASQLAGFFEEPRLRAVAQLFSLSFLLGAVGVVPRALLQRRMEFRLLARVDVVAAALAGSSAVILAILGFGVWSLVVQSLVSAAVVSLLALRLSHWSPLWRYSGAAVRDLLGYSANLFAFNFVNYWSRNADNLLIAKVIGPAGLGVYARAYSLMLMPITQVIRVISKVMFPTLASIQHDHDRVRRIFLRVLRMIMVVTAPMMVGLFVVADVFVHAVLGDRWAAVVPVLRILCAVGILQTVANPVGWIYQSHGRTDLLFRWGIGSSVVLVSAIAIGASFGTVEAVAWGYLVANVLLLYPCVVIPGRLIGMTFGDVFATVRGAIGCAVVMGILVVAVSALLPASWPGLMRLGIQVVAGVTAYGALLPVLCPTGYDEMRDVIREQRQRRRTRAVAA